MPEVPVLVESLVDDAALFPPGNVPMPDALRAHVMRWQTDSDAIAGRFLCPASRVGELQAELGRLVDTNEAVASLLDSRSIALGVILDTGIAAIPRLLADLAEEPRVLLALVVSS